MPPKYPKVLTVTRTVWDDASGTSSTDSNLFGNYDPSALSRIYIETKTPSTKHCYDFFQISEYALIRRIWNKRIKTGKAIHLLNGDPDLQPTEFETKEQQIMSHVRSNRSMVYTFAREILWLFNGWKSRELKNYLRKNNPDVLFIYGSPLILMNRLQYFVLKHVNKPAAFYFMDDIYTYESVKGSGILNNIYRFFLRKAVKRVVNHCQEFFVVSPKMKKEYDAIFNINSKILTKGINFSTLEFKPKAPNRPLKIVYLGQVIYGRVYSLMAMANTLKKVNEHGVKAELFIYTGNFLSKEMLDQLEHSTSHIMPLVPYEQVQQIMADADVVVFAESLNEKYKNVARLSFSTKITDYLSSGKCIFAIGPHDSAPIEYLKDDDVAVVASDKEEIGKKLTDLILNPEIINEYAKKSFQLGKQNHSLIEMNNRLYNTFSELAVKNSK